MNVSIVLPIYRAPAVLPELIARLTSVVQARSSDYEIIAVNDACPEGSEAVLRHLADNQPRLRVVNHPRNLGQQYAVLTGIRQARGEYVVILDADLQDAPEDIPILLDILTQGKAHAVFAGRRGTYQSWTRMQTSRLFKHLLARLLHVPPDAGSFVAMTRRMADSVGSYAGPNPYLLALVGATRLPVLSTPVTRSTRPIGASSYTAIGRATFAARALRTSWTLRNATLRREGA
jgi:glycosyltransferase involved in cell wall biosynthesis